jgi:hypothetical protein
MSFLDRIRRGDAKKQRLIIPAKKVGSSRAIYQGSDSMPLAHFQIDTPDGDLLTIELDFEQLRTAIESLTHTFHAINPPLRNRHNIF